jgi:preprotein translocase subunit YajC
MTSKLLLLLQDPPADATKPTSSPWGMFVPMLLVVAIFYFVLIRPERKKQKKRDTMLRAMAKGDRVMTTSGMYGSVVAIQDDTVTLQVAEGVRLRFARAAVQNVLQEGEAAPAPEPKPS